MPKYRVAGPFPPVPEAVAPLLDPTAQRAFGKVVAHRLYEARLALVRQHGDLYSQERVARVLGRSQTWLSNLENGHRRVDAVVLRLRTALYQLDPMPFLAPPAPGVELALYEQELRAAAQPD